MPEKITLSQALNLFSDQQSDIVSACQVNIMQIIRSHQPARELTLDEEWSKEDLEQEVNRQIIAEKTRPLVKVLNMVNRRNAPVVYGRITDADIEQAREYPIDELLEFKRGVALCLWHEDTNPSLSHFKKANRVSCFVCNKTWSSIDVVMAQDNCNFIQAVKKLCS